jgi:hypothetical protein
MNKRTKVDSLVEAFLQSELMDERAGYLQRGRRFSELSDAELQTQWTLATKAWILERRESDQQKMSDLGAELGLRDIEPPYHTVEREMEAVQEEIREESPNNPALRVRVQAFLRDRKAGH